MRYTGIDFSIEFVFSTSIRVISVSHVTLVLALMGKNNLKKIRESMLLSKSELSRKAGISPLTIDRIERGYSCRMDTKRKIIQALGLKLSDKGKVFSD